MASVLHDGRRIPPEWWGDFVPSPGRDEANEIALNLRGGVVTRELLDRARVRLSNVARVHGTTVAQILRRVGWSGQRPVRMAYIADALEISADVQTSEIGGVA